MFELSALSAALTLHGPVARVVIAAHDGSSPREVGASMLVWEGGQSGTIGGGALEFEAAAKARAATERPDPGGPVNSQAWVIAAGVVTACSSVATATS